MKSKFKMSLKKDNTYRLTGAFTGKSVKCRSFRDEAIESARGILQKHKEAVLLLDNNYESLAMLEAFTATGKKFEVAALSFAGQPNPLVTNWQKRLKKIGLELQVITFDFSDGEQRLALERLQQQFDVMSMDVLFSLWLACHFDKYAVFPGEFCLPRHNSLGKIESWGLPQILDLARYDFAQTLGAEPFFMTSTHGLFRAQIESVMAAANCKLNVVDKRHLADRKQLKQIFYKTSGMKEFSLWPVEHEKEPLWKAAMRFADRKAHEEISRIINTTRTLLAKQVSYKENPGGAEIRPFDPKNSKMQRVYRMLKKDSTDLHWLGGAHRISEAPGGDSVYVAFPMLMTEHKFTGDIKGLKKTVQQLPFYKNELNSVSATDLHLYPEFSEVMAFVDEKIRFYFEAQGWVVYDYEITQCWANRATAGEAHHLHRHPNSMLSGILYLHASSSGGTVFVKETPELSIVQPRRSHITVFNSRTVYIHPSPGTLVLFPSYLTHEVTPHESTDENRYTLAFNAYVRGVIGDVNEGTWLDLRKPL